MPPAKPAPEQEALPRAMRREVFGQRTLFDWVFVVIAVGGGWTAATILAEIRSDQRSLQRDKVSHVQLMRYTLRAASEMRGEFGKLPPYEPPDDGSATGGQK